MSSEQSAEFTSESINRYLKEVAKEYRKQVGKSMPAEVILIGGASVLVNYGFRNMTTDIDALFYAASVMKDVINKVGDRFGLPNGWMNTDFQYTSSYSPKLAEYSVYYRTYSNVLTIRTVAAEYLIAMKLCSGRQYKNDLSDVLGILGTHAQNGMPITLERIHKAVNDLYGSWDSLPKTSQAFIVNVMEDGDYETLYQRTLQTEKDTREYLEQFNKEYPNVLTDRNVDEIVRQFRKESEENSVLTEMYNKKSGRTI